MHKHQKNCLIEESRKRTRHPLFECGQVAVRSECGHIVDEWQVLLDIALRPIAEE